jgi:hypothetical protein
MVSNDGKIFHRPGTFMVRQSRCRKSSIMRVKAISRALLDITGPAPLLVFLYVQAAIYNTATSKIPFPYDINDTFVQY